MPPFLARRGHLPGRRAVLSAALMTTAVLLAALPSRAAAAPAAAPEPACTLPPGLAELSGLAMSTRHPGIVYAVNDSGNTNQVFAVDCTGATGTLKATYTLSGATNTDWEALSVGKDAQGVQAILVGDIGDNFSGRPVASDVPERNHGY